VRAALASVESGGSTALFEGWEAGAKVLEAGVANATSRVLLLSDGQANEGLLELAEIQKHCARWAGRGVSTTTVGLGRGFNEELMIGMARSGGGQHYYGQRAEDLHDSFDEELALLQSLYLRRLRLNLVPAPGVLIEPLGDLQPGGPEGVWCLPDLAWEAEAWMLLRLHVPSKPDSDPRKPEALFAATVEGEQDGSVPVQEHAMLSLPRMSGSDLQGMPADPVVMQRLQEVEFAAAAARIHALLSDGNVAQAGKLLKNLEARVSSHPWLCEKLAALRTLMQQDVALSAKEARYASVRMSRRLTSIDEATYRASETNDVLLPPYLRRKAAEGEGRKRKP
jgi:Ca-activated chloride channel family protein